MTMWYTSLADSLDDLVDILSKGYNDKFYTSVFSPNFKPDYPYDMYEEDDKIIIEIPVVGLDKKDIKIEIKQNILRISSDQKKEKETNYFVKKIAKRNFDISWKISEHYNLNEITAKVDKGILMVEIPKYKETKKNKFFIDIK
jgi:HSP20 family protein